MTGERNELETEDRDLESGGPGPDPSAESHEEPDTSTSGEDSAADTPKAKGVQKRIDELTANWRNTERDRDEWRRLAQQLMEEREREGQPQGQAQGQAPEPPAKPAPDNYSDYDSYLEALAEWKADQRLQSHLSEQQQRQQQEAQQQTQRERVQAFQQKAQEFAQQHPDFESVAMSPSVPITQSMFEVIIDSEQGPEIAYHLGQHPDTAQKIARMNATAAAREIGKLEAQLSIPAKPRASQAPDPVEPVGGGSERNAKDPEKMTTEEWMAWRRKQLFG